jgi:hypothetical protein
LNDFNRLPLAVLTGSVAVSIRTSLDSGSDADFDVLRLASGVTSVAPATGPASDAGFALARFDEALPTALRGLDAVLAGAVSIVGLSASSQAETSDSTGFGPSAAGRDAALVAALTGFGGSGAARPIDPDADSADALALALGDFDADFDFDRAPVGAASVTDLTIGGRLARSR